MLGLRRPWCPRSVGLAVLGGAAIALAGCSDGGPKLHPVTGQVFYEDKPAEGAVVMFRPVKGTPESLYPSGVVGRDGTYALKTYPHGDGAPEGEYVVAVTWYEPAPPSQDEDEEGPEPKSKLPARYADSSQSGLKATIKPGENTVEPFRLSKKLR